MSNSKLAAILLIPVLLLCYFLSLYQPLTGEGVYTYSFKSEAEQVQGTWAELQDWRFSLGGLNGLDPWFQTPSLKEMAREEIIGELEQADSLTVYVFLDNHGSVGQVRAGCFVWGRSETAGADVEVWANTGSQLAYLGSKSIYHLPLLQQKVSQYEQAETRRKTYIPLGIHPLIFWVLLAYFGFVGLLLGVSWLNQELAVVETCREIIQDGPLLEGKWDNIKVKTVKLPKYKYTSPALAELLPGEVFSHVVKIAAYTVVKSRIQEARTGPLVWARARETRVELMLVVESGKQRFTLEARPTISHIRGIKFNDTPALMERAAKRKRWLFPAGLTAKGDGSFWRVSCNIPLGFSYEKKTSQRRVIAGQQDSFWLASLTKGRVSRQCQLAMCRGSIEIGLSAYPVP